MEVVNIFNFICILQLKQCLARTTVKRYTIEDFCLLRNWYCLRWEFRLTKTCRYRKLGRKNKSRTHAMLASHPRPPASFVRKPSSLSTTILLTIMLTCSLCATRFTQTWAHVSVVYLHDVM